MRVSIDAENGQSELSYQSNLMPPSAFQPQHLSPTTDALLRIPWGTQQTDIDRLTQEGTPLQRAAWTHAETNYLDNWENKTAQYSQKKKLGCAWTICYTIRMQSQYSILPILLTLQDLHKGSEK